MLKNFLFCFGGLLKWNNQRICWKWRKSSIRQSSSIYKDMVQTLGPSSTGLLNSSMAEIASKGREPLTVTTGKRPVSLRWWWLKIIISSNSDEDGHLPGELTTFWSVNLVMSKISAHRVPGCLTLTPCQKITQQTMSAENLELFKNSSAWGFYSTICYHGWVLGRSLPARDEGTTKTVGICLFCHPEERQSHSASPKMTRLGTLWTPTSSPKIQSFITGRSF